jgi:hypothetical protein
MEINYFIEDEVIHCQLEGSTLVGEEIVLLEQDENETRVSLEARFFLAK